MKHLDLFSGIGGFALAAERVWGDVEHVFVEYDPFCQEVLKKHWPNSTIHGDIRQFIAEAESTTDARGEESRRVHEQPRSKGSQAGEFHLLTGGFPCQPFSQAGRRKGTADDRYLWPEMLRVIREFHPRWIIGENVGGLVTWSEGLVLEQVHADLESEGYEVQSFIIPAVSVNAPHRRDRVWIVGHAKYDGLNGTKNTKSDRTGSDSNTEGTDELRQSQGTDSVRQDAPHTERKGHKGEVNQEGQSAGHSGGTQSPDWSANWIEVATRLCRVDDGIPRRLDRNPRLKALGNAIVPQVAEEIMRSILTTINQVI